MHNKLNEFHPDRWRKLYSDIWFRRMKACIAKNGDYIHQSDFEYHELGA